MTRTGNQKFAQHIHHSGQVVDPDDASTTVETSLGAAQTVSLIGPFRVDYDSGVSNGAGTRVVSLAPLPPNATVVRAWAVMREVWSGSATLALRLSDTVDETGPLQTVLSQLDLGVDESWADAADVSREITTGTWVVPADIAYCYVGVSGPSGAFLTATIPDGAFTTGAADVYALIATPSS